MLRKISSLLPYVFYILRSILKSKIFFIILSGIIIILAGNLSLSYVLSLQFKDSQLVSTFLAEKHELVELSKTILLILLIITVSIIGNWPIAIGVFYSLITIIMFINTQKMASRHTPFLPEDLAMTSEAGSLSHFVNIRDIIILLASVFIILLFSVIINRFLKRKYKIKTNHFVILSVRIFAIFIGINILMTQTSFLRNDLNGKGTFFFVEKLNTNVDFTSQAYNYETNGFIVGTITNLREKKQPKPANYSKKEVDKITQKYINIAKEQNDTKKDPKEEKVNIVYVMSESFIDPSLGKHIYDYGKKDPIPYTHKLLKKHTSGWAASSEYGGGTANVEFEALTGFSNFFLNTIPYSSLVSGNNAIPSLPRYLSQYGYSTIALHPYKTTMYKRNSVYPTLGFKKFKGEDDFKYKDTLEKSPYISDESAFKQTIDELKESENPAFIHLVTMQNHMPYENIYENNPFSVTAKNNNTEEAHKIEGYLRGINYSDNAMKNFIASLNKLNEKTIVVFWGDHWPGIYGDVFGNYQNEHDIRRTPLLVYSNFENEKVKLGTQSLNYTQVTALSQANLKLSPFQYMLNDLRQSFPALNKDFVTMDEAEKNQLLKDYEMIEYDILSGEKFSKGKFFQ